MISLLTSIDNPSSKLVSYAEAWLKMNKSAYITDDSDKRKVCQLILNDGSTRHSQYAFTALKIAVLTIAFPVTIIAFAIRLYDRATTPYCLDKNTKRIVSTLNDKNVDHAQKFIKSVQDEYFDKEKKLLKQTETARDQAAKLESELQKLTAHNREMTAKSEGHLSELSRANDALTLEVAELQHYITINQTDLDRSIRSASATIRQQNSEAVAKNELLTERVEQLEQIIKALESAPTDIFLEIENLETKHAEEILKLKQVISDLEAAKRRAETLSKIPKLNLSTVTK